METEQADALLDKLEREAAGGEPIQWLNTDRPDIYLIILESFSSHLMPSLGGEPVALRLDSIAASGVLFENFYASGFRTDRALPAILNGFPAQPSTSIIKFTSKTEHLPALAASLDSLGYFTRYFYGGDINFTNMNSLLISGGFRHIVSDAQFMVNPLASKWGAPDHMVFEEAARTGNSLSEQDAPQFMVIQTSSSHEPFDVPFASARFSDNPRLNAFAYTDSCLAEFIKTVNAGPRGDRALFVIVPDHYGAYPEVIEDPLERHRIPLVFTGDALALKGARISRPGAQPDIAPTILAALGGQDSTFVYGHNLMRTGSQGYAFFVEPGLSAIVTPTDTAVVNIDAGTAAFTGGPDADNLVNTIKAYVQRLYDAMDAL